MKERTRFIGVHSKTILIVDDDPNVRFLLERCLAREGHRLTLAANAAAALVCFEKDAFDLIITDRGMPGMSGEELGGEIKKRNPRMPVILISGHPPQAIDRSRFDAIMSKPFNKEALLASISALLPHP